MSPNLNQEAARSIQDIRARVNKLIIRIESDHNNIINKARKNIENQEHIVTHEFQLIQKDSITQVRDYIGKIQGKKKVEEYCEALEALVTGIERNVGKLVTELTDEQIIEIVDLVINKKS